MKTIKHSMLYVRDPKTGQFQSLQAIVGESAYEIAVRLGTFSGTEEQWNNYIKTERDAALVAIVDKGKQTLESIPEDYVSLTKKVDELTQRIESLEKV